ncbi:hypothetical protein FH608_050090 [Nonomuraea phyllanthi]|uniref:Uncharacterized protein n=1 Tax=Nonomuraea phyllanthi TaxID=2219224 RepID=A0A5C4UUK4_9ACTN|nr:hypothetical protein [Nonomuraea phyllanthi]KAB8182654.1 hypothetical protein FH608_050090 [Nonomuraea phyllanthi]
MSETPPNEPRGSRLLLALQGAGAVMGTVLIVWLSFPDVLAWARSPEGLDQSTFWAWLTAVWVAASPAMLAISAWLAWRDGRSARALIAVAFIP